jgi:hypothetical protein
MKMKKLTKEQAIIISAYTGFLICDFGDMHAEVEKRVGRPVWTHEFGNKQFADVTVRELFKDDFVALAPEKESPK